MTKKEKKKRNKKSEDTLTDLNLLDLFATDLNQIERKHNLTAGAVSFKDRLSTGMLVTDLVLNGGIVPGMYSVSGPEQSAKSTFAMTVLGSAINRKVPVVLYFDAEGSVDPTYTSNILRVKELTSIFGERDPKTGQYLTVPKVRYYPENIHETVFDTITAVLRMLPDKKYRAEDDQWYYVFDKTVASRELRERMGLTADKKLYTETGLYWCKTKERGIQSVIVVDSWPSLVAKAVDEDTSSNAMAFDARLFSANIKRVAGKLRDKGVVIFGVNQIRQKPAVLYGSPDYEPGGNALKFYSSVRNQIRARSCPSGWGKGQIGEEDNVITGGVDQYQYKLFKNTKNKTGTPFHEGWMRVWISDPKKRAYGFCPAFDSYQYLIMTGQLIDYRGKLTLNFDQSKQQNDLKEVKLTWILLKKWVLAEYFDLEKLKQNVKEELGIASCFINLRHLCFKQVESGLAQELYATAINKGKGSENYEDLEADLDDLATEEEISKIDEIDSDIEKEID